MRKIICPDCGREIWINEEDWQLVDQAPTPEQNKQKDKQKEKRKHFALWIVSFLVAALICGAGYLYFLQKQSEKEFEAYEYAMRSSDPAVLQSYLSTYEATAPQAHIDSIGFHLTQIQQIDTEWTNAITNGTRKALAEYMEKYPDSPHRREAAHKLDSLDWVNALKGNTVEDYKNYLELHVSGDFYDDAQDSIKSLNAKSVQPEERQMVTNLFRKFFQSINTRNEDGLLSTVDDVLSSFLGKEQASPSDVSTFMQKIYKEDVTNMNWYVNNDYKIEKREIGDRKYEYTVSFTARQEIERSDDTKEKSALYRINGKVSPEGRITAFNLTKIFK